MQFLDHRRARLAAPALPDRRMDPQQWRLDARPRWNRPRERAPHLRDGRWWGALHRRRDLRCRRERRAPRGGVYRDYLRVSPFRDGLEVANPVNNLERWMVPYRHRSNELVRVSAELRRAAVVVRWRRSDVPGVRWRCHERTDGYRP